MRRPSLSAAVLVVGLAACAPPDTLGKSVNATGMEAAMAATYRYIFANNGSGLQDSAATYCVGVGRQPDLADPSPALRAALSDIKPHVQAASSCRIDGRVLDAAGRPALLFMLAPVNCDSPNNCLFEGGYHEANISASRSRYRARKVDGQWRVAPEGPQAIS